MNNIILKSIINKDSLNNQERIFQSWGSIERIDRQGDLILIDEFKPVIEKLQSLGYKIPIQDSHTNHNCGEIIKVEFLNNENGEKGIFLTGKIYSRYPTDDDIWECVKSGKFSGMSLGGRADSKIPTCDQNGCYNLLKNPEIWEFSLVETPANPGAVITQFNKLAKSLKFSKDDVKRIGDKLNIDFSKISIDEFVTGINIETEHGKKNSNTNITDDDEILTAKIALAHLLEFPNYYSKNQGLPKLENQLQKARVYIKTPSEAPQGSQVYTGPEGGKYYETEEIENRSKREEVERQQKMPKISIKSLKDIIGEEKYNEMDKSQDGKDLKNLLDTYTKISNGTVSNEEVNKTFDFIKNKLPNVFQFYDFIGSNPKNETEMAHKRVAENIAKLQERFNTSVDRKDKIIAIDNFINTAHVNGDNIILRLWRSMLDWSKEISPFIGVPQKYLDYLRVNIGKSLSEEIEVNKGVKSFLVNVRRIAGKYLDEMGIFEIDEWVETHWQPNTRIDPEWNDQIKQVWRNKDKEYNRNNEYKHIHKAKVYVKTPSDAPSNVKLQEGERGGHYYESDQESKPNNTKSPHEVSNLPKSELESNIEIITSEINNENILDSLESFAKEGNIEALPPPTMEEVKRLVDISGISKNIKVVAIPYWSETVNAYTYMGDDVIYLMSNNAELDKEILEETRWECRKAGYDIKNMTLENRKIGTLIHEEAHIKTYKKAGITSTSQKDFERLHFTFTKYEELIMAHFKKDQDTIFDGEVLLELIAEDGRINHIGRGNEFPHRYFYYDDIQNPQFKQDRANILREMGMI